MLLRWGLEVLGPRRPVPVPLPTVRLWIPTRWCFAHESEDSQPLLLIHGEARNPWAIAAELVRVAELVEAEGGEPKA